MSRIATKYFYILTILSLSINTCSSQNTSFKFPIFITCDRLESFYDKHKSTPVVDVNFLPKKEISFNDLVYLNSLIDKKYNNFDMYERKLIKWLLINQLKINNFIVFTDEKMEIYCASSEKIYCGDHILNKEKYYFSLKLIFDKTDTTELAYNSVCYFNQQGVNIHFDHKHSSLPCEGKLVHKEIDLFNEKIQVEGCADMLENQKIQPCRSYQTYEFIDTSFRNVIIGSFENQLKRKSIREKLDYLLHFCQNLDYKSDKELYNREVVFSPEATLLADYSDCEDRAILFANLVKNLFPDTFHVAIVEFEDHVMIGIESTKELPKKESDYIFKYKEKKFIAFEPTGEGYESGNIYSYLKQKTPNFYFVN